VIRYVSVEREAEAEQTIERSRFIGCARPAASRAEAEEFFAGRRTLHRGATHHVPAFVIGEKNELQWASDDGEPQGTSGAPIVRMLTEEGITNTAIVVTRYFGGIKLGTGGLVRAYTSSARLALQAAGLCAVSEQILLSFRLDYTFYGKIQNAAAGGRFRIQDAAFTDKATVTLAAGPEDEEAVCALAANLTAGTCELLSRNTGFVRNRLPAADCPGWIRQN
jgi:uncharacterized YigZ family protein